MKFEDSHRGRRECMQCSAAGVALADDSTPLPQPAGNPQVSLTTEADVLVVGGGTAGTIAAIQAARAGAKTLIVERGPQLGGTATTGGVSFPGLFDAWGKQIIAGIVGNWSKKAWSWMAERCPTFRRFQRVIG